MNILVIHQNFPAQYRYLAPALADRGHQVIAIGETRGEPRNLPGVRFVGYNKPNGAAPQTHPAVRNLENAVHRAEIVQATAEGLAREGFIPDLICVHPGWGEALYLREVFPRTPILGFFEFYYRTQGADVGFDPEYPVSDLRRVRTKNAVNLLSLDICDWGISPTLWQASTYPAPWRQRLSVIFDGVDTDRVRPDPAAVLRLGRDGIDLSARDEIITFVNRNLEPYRGYHVFMRALPEIMRRRPKAHVVIVGGNEVSYGNALPDGSSYKDKYLQEVQAGLDMARVHFVGRVPYPLFVALMQLSAAHVYLTYPFVLSWSMIEAMAAGALVIGSRTPPVEEVITDGENGLLVDFFDSRGIAEAVDRVLDHPDRMAAMRARARQTVVERYDLKRVCLPRQIALAEAVAAGRLPVDEAALLAGVA